ncbi:uncharacterized protein SCHCODRAFT_02558048 [Schizophyllum commune H4-8]|nr:uncharacterized protein SCHCODRAFT_02558048 [Schizophyllum commune H4-8]KAI5885056.1 hypothetical protein SCHCODRAFT_02558048 [Schizophyllum commune H4-8]
MYNGGESTTPWAKRFAQAIQPFTSIPSSLDLEFLRSPIVKEAHARLSPSKLPHPPMNPSDVRPIDEAAQALLAYAPLLEAATTRGGAVAKEAYTIFDNIWKWIVFFRPSTVNVADNGMQDNARPAYDDGDIFLGMLPLWFVFRQYIANALAHKEGRKRCIAQLDFIAITLEILTSECPLIEAQDSLRLERFSHGIVRGLASLLSDQKLSRRLTAEICDYDLQNPGFLMENFLDEMEAFLRTTFDNSLIMAYMTLTATLLSNNENLERFLHVRIDPSSINPPEPGMTQLCHFLRLTVSRNNGEETAATLPLATHWIAQITKFARSYACDILTEVLDAGILEYLVGACVDPRGQLRAPEWQAPATAFVRDVLVPALFRTKYLPAFVRATKDSLVQSADLDVIRQASHEIADLLLRIPVFEQQRQTMKADLKRIRHCHNGDSCPGNVRGSRRLRMCICGRAFYCSRTCQKAHWRTHKPLCCPPDARRHMSSEHPDVTLTHFERCFLKRMAFKDIGQLSHNLCMPWQTLAKACVVDYTASAEPERYLDKDPMRPPARSARAYSKIRYGPGDATIFMGFLSDPLW